MTEVEERKSSKSLLLLFINSADWDSVVSPIPTDSFENYQYLLNPSITVSEVHKIHRSTDREAQ